MNDEPRNVDIHQEEEVIPWRRILFSALLGLAIMAALIVAASRSLSSGEAKSRPSGVFPEEHLGPRRSVMEVQQDLFGEGGFGLALNARKHKELSSFGWVDRDKRRVRIPIDQAMTLVVEGSRP